MSLFAECYFKIQKVLLALGLWPTEQVQLRTVITLILMLLFCLSGIIKNIVDFDKTTASDAFTHCNGAILVIVYYYIFIKDRQRFCKLLSEIGVDLSHDDMNFIESKCMRKAGTELRRLIKIGFCIFVCAVAVKFIQPIGVLVYNKVLMPSETFSVYPAPMALPIIYHESITYCLEVIATTIILTAIIGLMTIFMISVLYISAQLKAISEMLIADECPGIQQVYIKNSNHNLNKCIQRHIQLFKLSTILASLYGPILWIDCILSTINICFVLFSLATQLTVEHVFVEFLFLCAGVSQLFLANWFSDRLLTSSLEVSLGAYSSKWPELDSNYRRKILFVIQRSQMPMTMQYFGKFTPSLEVFVNICTSAWGYYNILRTVVHNN